MAKKCAIDNCGKPAGVPGTARGLCSMHYSRWLRNGDPNIRSQHVYLTHQPCSVKDCDRLVVGRSLCATHWMRWKRRGDPCDVLPYRAYWSERDIQRMEMILDRAPDGLGYAECGELVHAAFILERTVGAVGSKLRDLRRDRRRAQNRTLFQKAEVNGMSEYVDRDDQGVVLQGMLEKLSRMIEAAEGDTIDERLATMLAFIVAAGDLGPERSQAAFVRALAEQTRIRELLDRARTTPRH